MHYNIEMHFLVIYIFWVDVDCERRPEHINILRVENTV